MKVRVLLNYLKSMDAEAEVQFQVPGKNVRYNVRHAEEQKPSTIAAAGGKTKVILQG